MKKPSTYQITFYSLMLMLLTLLWLSVSSCSSEKKLQKAINNHGQKESLTFFVKNYPEYFRQDTVIIRDTIAVIVPERFIDTTFVELRDTIILENEKIKVVLQKVDNGWQLSGTAKADTIYHPIELPCPPIHCPDIEKLQTTSNWWHLAYFILGAVTALIFVWLAFQWAYTNRQ
jgi:hypothetical protein